MGCRRSWLPRRAIRLQVDANHTGSIQNSIPVAAVDENDPMPGRFTHECGVHRVRTRRREIPCPPFHGTGLNKFRRDRRGCFRGLVASEPTNRCHGGGGTGPCTEREKPRLFKAESRLSAHVDGRGMAREVGLRRRARLRMYLQRMHERSCHPRRDDQTVPTLSRDQVS
jgi:hypothetical protein